MSKKALEVLKNDPYLAPWIEKRGVPKWEERGDPFRSLVRSIIYQQVTGKAAASILAKFVALFPQVEDFPTPTQVLEKSVEELRGAGLSGQKTAYIQDLAEKFLDGTIDPLSFSTMSNDEIIEHVVRVKGVGVWTAHMFLMTTLKRPDILPTGDLGIQKGFQVVYKLRSLPTHKKMEQLAKPWRAYATTASWYLWRAADEAKIKPLRLAALPPAVKKRGKRK
jgi:DNA-3-methyladenine glycosylase II